MTKVAQGAVALCLLALVLSATATATRPVSVSDGKTQMVFNAGVAPQGLPAKRWARAAVVLSVRVSALDESQPLATRRLLVEADKRLAFHFKGLPVCRPAQIQASPGELGECEGAIVGGGSAEFDNPQAHGPIIGGGVVAYNGGLVRGNRRLWLRYTGIPATPPIVDFLDIKQTEGRNRTKLVVPIPKVAGGSGSLTTFSLDLHKGVRATCPTGRIWFQATSVFADGSRLTGRLNHLCTSTGP